MANYIGDYQTDTGKTLRRSKLQVFLVLNTSLTTVSGTRQNTDTEFDSTLLPTVFLNSVSIPSSKFEGCTIDLVRPRFAKLYTSQTTYLHVDLPFLPNSTKFNQFFIESSSSNFIDIISVGIEGEFIGDSQLQFLTRS